MNYLKWILLGLFVSHAFVSPCLAASTFDPNQLNVDLQKAFPERTEAEFLAFFANGTSSDIDLRDQGMKGLQALKLDPSVIEKRNDWIMQEFLRHTGGKTGVGLTRREAQAMIIEARDNKTIGLTRTYGHFDPVVKGIEKDPEGNVKYTFTRQFGYCWGRAEYLYLKLLKKRVDKSGIFRLFYMGNFAGDLNYGHPWPWHVATIVKARDADGWYALDPVYGEVLTAEQWLSRNHDRLTDPRNPPIVYLGEATRAFPARVTDDPDDILRFLQEKKYSPLIVSYYQDLWNLFGGIKAVKKLQSKAPCESLLSRLLSLLPWPLN